MKEFENVAVFPHKVSGRFNHSLTDPTTNYEVNGETMEQTGNDSASSPSPVSPFGAFTGPTVSLPPHFQLVHRMETRAIKRSRSSADIFVSK